MPLDPHREANRLSWDERVPIHVASRTYDIAGFLSDSTEISGVVRFDKEHVGDVQGRSLLHLQSHFGRDTLSWARLGANLTLFGAPRAQDVTIQLRGGLTLAKNPTICHVHD